MKERLRQAKRPGLAILLGLLLTAAPYVSRAAPRTYQPDFVCIPLDHLVGSQGRCSTDLEAGSYQLDAHMTYGLEGGFDLKVVADDGSRLRMVCDFFESPLSAGSRCSEEWVGLSIRPQSLFRSNGQFQAEAYMDFELLVPGTANLRMREGMGEGSMRGRRVE